MICLKAKESSLIRNNNISMIWSSITRTSGILKTGGKHTKEIFEKETSTEKDFCGSRMGLFSKESLKMVKLQASDKFTTPKMSS